MFNIFLDCLCWFLIALGLSGALVAALPALDGVEIWPRVGLFFSGLFLTMCAVEFRRICYEILTDVED